MTSMLFHCRPHTHPCTYFCLSEKQAFENYYNSSPLSYGRMIRNLFSRVSLCKCCTLVMDIGSLYQRLAGEIDVFDSLRPFLYWRQIAALATIHWQWCCPSQVHIVYYLLCLYIIIIIWYKQCELQSGSSDCGLFATGFAAGLAAGEQPIRNATRSPKLLIKSPFPVRRRGRCLTKICECRMPASFSNKMVQNFRGKTCYLISLLLWFFHTNLWPADGREYCTS